MSFRRHFYALKRWKAQRYVSLRTQIPAGGSFITMNLGIHSFLVSFFICSAMAASAMTNSYLLSYSPAPPGNPLKGFMPYSGNYSTFPYSMEWDYLPLRSLMTGPTNFDWSTIDALLNNDASRGHQTVFDVYLDYPALPTGIPQYLLDAGLVAYSYTNYGNDGISVSPDYENPLLDQALMNFIAALGARYDGDPRVGFVELGLLGYWGEWHTYPETNWFASTAVQDAVLTAYAGAFHQTKVLVRWPAGDLKPASLPVGYHDDSFAYDTIAPPAYNFSSLLAAAGETNKWQTQPIGGEFYPPIQLCAWNPGPSNCVPPGQAFSNCVALTHTSWILNQAVFDPGFSGTQQDLALMGARQLGYELYVTNATLVQNRGADSLSVTIGVLNQGVAPFYYDWPVQLAVWNTSNGIVQSWTTPWKLSCVYPGSNSIWTCTNNNLHLPAGQYKLLLGVMNPMTNGAPLRFANQTQDSDLAGWLTLGQLPVFRQQPNLNGAFFPLGFILHASNMTPGIWSIEDTSNGFTWTTLLTTNIATAQWSFVDQEILPDRFYRVVSQP